MKYELLRILVGDKKYCEGCESIEYIPDLTLSHIKLRIALYYIFYKSKPSISSVVFSCKFTNSIYYPGVTGVLFIFSLICCIVSN